MNDIKLELMDAAYKELCNSLVDDYLLDNSVLVPEDICHYLSLKGWDYYTETDDLSVKYIFTNTDT